jgi:mono/diheme cytochrome c family protein
VERHNGSARAARWIAICVLAGIGAGAFLLAAGCGSGSGSGGGRSTAARSAPAKPPPDPKVMRIGARVFHEICHSCHTMLGKPHLRITNGEPAGPNLDEVVVGHAYVEERVEHGGIAMAGWRTTLSAPEFSAIVTYVTHMAGRSVGPDEQNDVVLATGEQVFAEHCNLCHSIADRPRTGAPGLPGADFTKVKPSEKYVEWMVTRRYGYMEAFHDKLTRAQIQAVAKFIQATAGS